MHAISPASAFLRGTSQWSAWQQTTFAVRDGVHDAIPTTREDIPMSDVSDNSSIRSEVADKMLEKARQAKPQDAIDLLKADHKEALEVYAKFFKAESSAEKQSL